ncbi:hypothetical protein NIES4075_52190 [Tolypothrix sp. NIES-4075]|uniref:glycoside hydrolase family 55 protein n=1 Tax=Tolypothrix sp. NIES-4075 TaxID=2005459 RepID=UPI000B5CBF73|nr:glycoside hydrolase family 55 protein [Tolypothrix sp. NIES-4075]GAX44202.1 hypothetical protein NIES4075_52190 [Tolypothrix sp. NIES-4075]
MYRNSSSAYADLLKLSCVLFLLLAFIGCYPSSVSANFVPPSDSRIVNVLDFGAKPNDNTDDTAAIQRAIVKAINTQNRANSPPFIFIPKGTYFISDTLVSRIGQGGYSDGWLSGTILMGESRKETILKLRDNLPAFSNPSNPKPVIMTGSESDGASNPSGSGNRAFRNSIYHLTVDVGTGNKGAVGIDYLASNRGAIEDVSIVSLSTEGITGISMQRNWPGPALIKNVSINGFDYGISVGNFEYHMTFEDILLKQQRVAGIDNMHNTLSIRGLTSINDVPAISVKGEHGFVILTDSFLYGGNKAKKSGVAIQSAGELVLKNIRVRDYAMAVHDTSHGEKNIKDSFIQEYTSQKPITLFPSKKTSLNLPVKATPIYESTKLSEWANAESFGASGTNMSDDDAAGIQAAIDSGKAVVYLPNGNYSVGSTIILRKNLKKLIGMQSSIDPKPGFKSPIFKLEDGKSSSVSLEHLYLTGSISHASKRTLVIRHCDFPSYSNTAKGTGDLFVEDVIGSLSILYPQNVWARQLNTEHVNPELRNVAGKVWVLGMKTEGPLTVLDASKGSQTEILGAAFGPLQDVPANIPVALINDAEVSLSYRTTGANGSDVFDYLLNIKETQKGVAKKLTLENLRSMGISKTETVSLYNSVR